MIELIDELRQYFSVFDQTIKLQNPLDSEKMTFVN